MVVVYRKSVPMPEEIVEESEGVHIGFGESYGANNLEHAIEQLALFFKVGKRGAAIYYLVSTGVAGNAVVWGKWKPDSVPMPKTCENDWYPRFNVFYKLKQKQGC